MSFYVNVSRPMWSLSAISLALILLVKAVKPNTAGIVLVLIFPVLTVVFAMLMLAKEDMLKRKSISFQLAWRTLMRYMWSFQTVCFAMIAINSVAQHYWGNAIFVTVPDEPLFAGVPLLVIVGLLLAFATHIFHVSSLHGQKILQESQQG